MLYPRNSDHPLNEENLNLKETFGLNNCDREPIHLPGSIQPNGYLIAFSGEGTVQYVSANFEHLKELAVDNFLEKPLHHLLGEKEALEVLKIAQRLKHKRYFSLPVSKANGEILQFDLILHKNQNLFILEMEPVQDENSAVVDLEDFNDSFRLLQETQSPLELAEVSARLYKELTGFNRVMVYRFHEDGSGEVIAEEKDEGLDPFLGLHYPASDIPRQVRALYLRNPVSIIPDVYYTPVPIYPFASSTSAKPLDLTLAGLRSISPIHIQYLKNMKVGASMSVAIIRGNKLWGLFALHHSQPLYIRYQYRQLCLLLSKAFSMVLGEKEELFLGDYRKHIQEVQATLLHRMSKAEKFTEGLYKYQPNVHDLIKSEGCILSFGGELVSLGRTPPKEQVWDLIRWLQQRRHEGVFYTHKLAEEYPEAVNFQESGSGIMAVAISQVQQEYIIWFRPEKIRTVRWAGKQEKEVNEKEGVMQLSPRASFEAWAEQVRNTSEAWLTVEVEAAKELRRIIVDLVHRLSGELKLRADILSRINQELGTSKSELESFAYIVSHDLKEPLRGIHSYASFVLEDYGTLLDQKGQAKLTTLMRLSDRMQQLIDSLLQFSRLGRFELNLEVVNLEEIVQEVLDVFDQRFMEEGVELKVEKDWPSIKGDFLRVSQVFTNLVSNALKYTDKAKKEIRIGYRKAREEELSPSGFVFYVQDNGIGIDPRYYEEVFHIFRRLHAREAYGGGIGAGLSISKKIVERHGGQIWIESEPGKGSTFYFSL